MSDAPSKPTQPQLPQDVPPSDRFGKFVRVEKLGAGGMGEVWKAWDTELARWVALKLLKGGDDEEIARFKREAQTAGKLSHPNIAAIHEVGESQGRHFIAMQYVEGQTLGTYPREDRKALARIVRDAARAVAYANEQGIVHRDIKPENVMVSGNRAYVMDFGLARSVEGERSVSGSIVGTPSYMPPEQARGERADARADVYAMGATLYELLTDRAPFRGPTVYDVLRKVEEEEPKAPRAIDATIDGDLETVVLKCLEKDRGRRYGSAAELADDLERWLAGEPIAARPASLAYRLRKRLAKRRALVLLAVAFAAALGLTLVTLLPMLTRARAAQELWGRISNIMAEAELLARAGEIPRSRAKLGEGISICREHAKRDDLPDAHYFLGRQLRMRRDLPDAKRALDRALELDPGLGEAHLERGLVHVEEYREKLAACEDSVIVHIGDEEFRHEDSVAEVEAREPMLRDLRERAMLDLAAPVGRSSYFREVDALYGRALLDMLRGNGDRSAATLQEVLERDPVNAGALLALCVLARDRRDMKAAMDFVERALERHRGLARAYYFRGSLRFLVKQPDLAIEDCSEALRIEPRLDFVRLFRGQVLMSKRQFKEAIADAEALLERNPANLDAILLRAQTRVAMGEVDRGMADLDEAIRKDPRARGAYCSRGAIWMQRGVPDRALADFSAAVQASPRFAPAYHSRGLVRRQMGDLDGAIEDQGKCLELGLRLAPIYTARADARQAKGDPEGALADLTEALRLKPTALLLLHRAIAWEDKGDAARAFADYEEALRLDPRSREAYNNRGRLKKEQGDLAGALADISRSIDIDPAQALPHVNRGTLRHQLGDRRGARLDFDTAVRLDPAMAAAFAGRGHLSLDEGDIPGTIADCTRAIELDPKCAGAYADRGHACYQIRDLDAAFDDFSEAIRLDPTKAQPYSNRGLVRQGRGDSEGALADYGKALEVDPRFATAYYNRSRVWRARGDARRMIEDLTEFLKLCPGDVDGWNSRGVARHHAGDLAGAIADYTESLRLSPLQPDALYSRGQARVARGDHATAISDFEKALEVAPEDWSERSRAEAALRELRERR